MRYILSFLNFMLASILVLGISSAVAHAEKETAKGAVLRLAVAADFVETAKRLGEDFTARTGTEVFIASGASGDLTAQIRSGVEYDIFLSADTKYPELLIEEKLALNELVIYAYGTIALFSPGRFLAPGDAPDSATDGKELLSLGAFDKLAVADPKKAPYGLAAVESLKKMNLYSKLKDSLVFGRNIAKTLKLVRTGAVDAGFVAYPDLTPSEKTRAWVVPSNMHAPIKQAAVLLSSGRINDSAVVWMKYLVSAPAHHIIRNSGYRIYSEHVIETPQKYQFLFVQSAKSGSFDGEELTLMGVPLVVYFSERPSRVAGHLSVKSFAEMWSKGDDSFSVDPPNATLSIFDESGAQNIVIEISNPVIKGDTITYKILRILSGTPPESFGPSTLFIDCYG